MDFDSGYIYHVFNQGNNRRKIFFSEKNYEFFKDKMEEHLIPHSKIMAYCLMPNHFHFMILVHSLTTDVTLRRQQTVNRSINRSIGVMLSSYTQVVNKEMQFSGSLFRSRTKAQGVNTYESKSFRFNQLGNMNELIPERQYPQVCFNYIHENPVKSGLVKQVQDWKHSSAQAYYLNKKDVLIDKSTALEYVDLY